MELGGSAQIPQATFALLDGFEAQAVAVEAPRAVEVLRRKLVTARAAPSGLVMTVSSSI